MTIVTTQRLNELEDARSAPIRHPICDACETVAHCSDHGCIPEVQYAPTRRDLVFNFDMSDTPPVTPEQAGRWYSLIVWPIVAVCCAAIVAVMAASRFN